MNDSNPNRDRAFPSGRILDSRRAGLVPPGRIWVRIFVMLLCGQLILGLLRVPRELDKKLDEIDDFQHMGRVAFTFRGQMSGSAAIVERLVRATPEDSLIYWEGNWKGDLELAAALLFPRLLVRFDPEQAGQTSESERSFARLSDPLGVDRLVVIQGRGKSLGLRWP